MLPADSHRALVDGQGRLRSIGCSSNASRESRRHGVTALMRCLKVIALSKLKNDDFVIAKLKLTIEYCDFYPEALIRLDEATNTGVQPYGLSMVRLQDSSSHPTRSQQLSF
uniref:Uncharacterized protein n=1 Tax=Vespula pensylvanica TaxID=30213 RepID=A0A834KE94_VESPE|nr:hypothetical protein H0235_014850 [Vespula pensylvanica]